MCICYLEFHKGDLFFLSHQIDLSPSSPFYGYIDDSLETHLLGLYYVTDTVLTSEAVIFNFFVVVCLFEKLIASVACPKTQDVQNFASNLRNFPGL